MKWVTKKLGDILHIARGGSPRPINSFITQEDNGINWIKIGDTKEGSKYIESTKQKIKQSGISKSRYVKKGDFLLSNSMSFGRPYILKIDGCIHDGWLVLSKYKDNFITDYLYYLLCSQVIQNQFEMLARGSTVRNLNINLVSNVTVQIPSLSEQQHIVTKLDKAFAEIDKMTKITMNKKKQITSFYESSKTNIFENILDFEEKPLKEVCEKITDGTHQTPKYFDSGYIFLSSRNVKSKKIDWDNIKYIDEKQHLEMQKRLSPRRGDVLLAKNGTTGMGAIVDRDINFDIYVSLALLRSKGDVLPEFLLEFINSKLANEQFSKRTKGIGVQNLHLQEIREVVIRYPKSKVEQNIIIKKLNFLNEQYDKLQSITEMKFQNLLSLKSSLLKKELQSA